MGSRPYRLLLSAVIAGLAGCGGGGGAGGGTTDPGLTGLPELAIADTAVTEGTAGSVIATFTVTLSRAGTDTITVEYATRDGSATAGADYSAASGTITFVPGQISRPVEIRVLGDSADEPDETFTVILSGPVNAALGDAEAVGTIIDDDPSDTTPPFVVASTPAADAHGVSRLLKIIVELSESIDPATVTPENVRLTRLGEGGSENVVVDLLYNDATREITLILRTKLSIGVTYIVHLEAVRDPGGNPLAHTRISFTTVRNPEEYVAAFDPAGNLIEYEQYLYHSSGLERVHVWYTDPGPDGVWFTGDDLKVTALVYKTSF